MAGIEATCERKVCETMKDDYGVENIKITWCGYPDRLFIFNKGVTVWVEFKKPGEEPTPLQYHKLYELRKNGHLTYWFDNHDIAVNVLADLLKRVNKKNESRI